VGYIVLATIVVFVLGIIVGRKMLMSVTLKLIDDNQKILSMQKKLIEKNRLAAITETVLVLGDQVNNPLLVINGNLELLDSELKLLEVGGGEFTIGFRRCVVISKKSAKLRIRCQN
jgi:hypothetical protein